MIYVKIQRYVLPVKEHGNKHLSSPLQSTLFTLLYVLSLIPKSIKTFVSNFPKNGDQVSFQTFQKQPTISPRWHLPKATPSYNYNSNLENRRWDPTFNRENTVMSVLFRDFGH